MQERSFVRHFPYLLSMTLLFSTLLWGCGGTDHGPALTLAGSTSVQPFAEKLADEYMATHPEALINVQGGGSTAGIQSVKEGVANIGTCSRNLKEGEKGDLNPPIEIARDGLAVIVHPDNPVVDLTLAQIRGLFRGQIKDWREVGVKEIPGAKDLNVRVITREDGSGTRGAFQELVMGETEISDDALVQDSNGAVREVVAGDRNIVGYISLGLVDPERRIFRDSVRAVMIDGVKPTEENIEKGIYKFSRPFLFLTKGPAEDLAGDFIKFVLSPAGQDMLAGEGLVRATERR